MEVSDDKDDEIIFKLPVSPVKEDSQKTPTPASSGRKRKSEQWSWQRSVCIVLGRCDLVIKAYCSLVGAATCKHRQSCWSKNTFCFSSEESHQEPGCFAPSCPEFVFRFIAPLALLSLWNSGLTTTQSLYGWSVLFGLCVVVYIKSDPTPTPPKICQASTSGIWNQKLNPESEGRPSVNTFAHHPGAEEESEMTHN